MVDYKTFDPDLWAAIAKKKNKDKKIIWSLLLPKILFLEAVMAAQGSILTNKYAEGYPGHRYYGGCEFVDIVGNLAIDRAKELFGAKFVNVQPHSGSQSKYGGISCLSRTWRHDFRNGSFSRRPFDTWVPS